MRTEKYRLKNIIFETVSEFINYHRDEGSKPMVGLLLF